MYDLTVIITCCRNQVMQQESVVTEGKGNNRDTVVFKKKGKCIDVLHDCRTCQCQN